MIIHSYKGKAPRIGEGTFVAETAAIAGDVKIGSQCSIWYSAVIRADGQSVEIGDRVNIQDCACVHITATEGGNTKIGNDVVIGHNATVHACTIGDRCLIGMGSTVLDGAVVGSCSVVAAGALVLGRTVIGEYELWGGVPAKFIKKITPEFVKNVIDAGVEEYAALASEYNSTLSENIKK